MLKYANEIYLYKMKKNNKNNNIDEMEFTIPKSLEHFEEVLKKQKEKYQEIQQAIDKHKDNKQKNRL